METVAIITDIHGNSPALKAVLEAISQRDDVSRIYCSGDLIGIGPDTNEVLELVIRHRIESVSGNHDEAILALVKGRPYPKSHEKSLKHHEWVAKHLDTQFVPYLENLPRQITTTFGSSDALITHYHYLNEKLPIDQDPFSPIVDPTFDNIKQLFSDNQEPFITFGHHHPVHYFHSLSNWWVNPGSLGCHVKAEARYALIHIYNEGLIVNLHAVPYDRDTWLKQYEQYKVPDREFILKAFHGQ
ncbi:metallophosphoesterase family protein [Pullulanibacillus sp. KACC 23026]|uniref:metallophosphoesterase family protein n=1 Tax=Pullulanibacillus sp. KACC 23026 TaxID=3028315 RepID=UPI0023AFC2A6|nr:metallophosphoesterase family protein [Pullulanibacillus sp. KACC 23026]WEG10796.1 metallophosphoesterase family protein [Pullulanibacillus sp. KACC 23026]